MANKNIAFLTGGYSGEAEISYKSAITIYGNLDKEKYNIYKIDIRQDGWWYVTDEGIESLVNKSDFSVIANGTVVLFDAIFIGIHGTPGEDGRLQGYFDLLNIPYTSCSAASSAITFNKRYTTAIAGVSGIAVAKSYQLFKDELIDFNFLTTALQFPVFVKPNNGGSSIGMSKVNDSQHLAAAIEKAFKEDNQVLIEEFIAGREFTVGVFKHNNNITTLPITEVIAKKDFFDFEAKYTSGLAEEVTPALIDSAIADKINNAAKKLYHVFDCSGVVRIDFIYNEAKALPYMLEINTVPGQSAASIVPQQVKAMGWSLKDFYTSLIEQALSNK
jgi:D-alanine-D-alanine ligase